MFKKIWEKIIVWWRLQQLQADSIIKKEVIAAVNKNIKVEEHLRCEHYTWQKIHDGSLFYRCMKCDDIILMGPSYQWTKEKFKKLQEDIDEGVK